VLKPRLLQDLIRKQADARPWATAIIAQGQRLTYGELDAASNRLARLLRAAGCRAGERVALLAPKSPAAIVALLGVYKADAIHVPLDPSSPANRLDRILDACQCHWMLAAQSTGPIVDELCLTRDGRRSFVVGSLDRGPLDGARTQAVFTQDDVAAYSSEPVLSRNDATDPAHILFTPGSAGTPKGVVITHANVMHFVEWAMGHFRLNAGDRVSGHSPLHLDLSFFDVFGAAAVGAELHLVPPELNVLPNRLADFIRGRELTQWFSMPATLNYMAKFDVVAMHDFPSLKRVIWAGEILPTPALMYLMERLPHASFTNLYGQAEGTIASSCYTVPARPTDAQASIPIGTACGGQELLVLNDRLEPVPSGEVGDLYLAGAGLSRGYWNDPDRTAAAFLHHPERPSEWIYKTGDVARIGDDGLVYFLGPSQAGMEGLRLELTDVEAAVNAVPEIVESAVVALAGDHMDDVTICCAYVPVAGSRLQPPAIGAAISGLVPRELIPERWLCLREFPVDANGKIDRHRLRDAFAARLDPTAARTA
jgi:amino acid adenylation domain-containing protein